MSSAQSVTATFQGFTISATALSPSSVAPGSSADSTVTITPSGGFNPANVALGCTITPVVNLRPTCKFSSIGSGGKSTLTVNTTGPSSSLAPFGHSGLIYAAFLPIGGMAFLGAGFGAKSRKKKLLGFLLLCIVLSGLVFLMACGSGGGQTGGGGGGGTPVGNYTITVTGTAAGFNQGGTAPQLSLNVQ